MNHYPHAEHCRRVIPDPNNPGLNNPFAPGRHQPVHAYHSGDWPHPHMARCGNCGVTFTMGHAHIIEEHP